MKFDVADHNGGLSVISADVYCSVIDPIKKIDFEMKKYSVPELKKILVKKISENGWSGPFRVDNRTHITISSKKGDVGLCIQLGNVSRIYADLLKLQVLYNKGIIKAGMIIVASDYSAKKMSGNMASFERLEREYSLYEEIITIPTVVIGFREE